jgi:hypothetical protein
VTSIDTINFTSINVGSAAFQPESLTNGSSVYRAGQTAANTIKLQAYDLGDAGYDDIVTISSHATAPTIAIASEGLASIQGVTFPSGTYKMYRNTTTDAHTMCIQGYHGDSTAYVDGLCVENSGAAEKIHVTIGSSSDFVLPNSATSASNILEGSIYWESDTDILTLGDGTTGINLDFAPNVTYTFPSATASLAPLVSPSFTTPAIGAATGTSLIATGIVDGLTNVTLTTDGSEDANVTDKMSHVIINKHTTEATAMAVNLPATAIAGMQLLVKNGYGDNNPTTGVITVYVPATHYAWNPTTKTQCAQGYDLVSGGAAGDYIGMVAISSTVWESIGFQGTWTCTATP